jgi:diguanylate cyclase (GGDEF)-like protein
METKTDAVTSEVTSALAQLRFLKGGLWQILAWLAVCLFIGALVWTLTLSRLASEKQSIQNAAFRDARSLSKSYAKQLSRTVEQLDQLTVNVAYHWKHSAGTLKLEEQANQGLYPDNANLSLGIADKRGKVITNLLEYSGMVDMSGRPFFQLHKKGLVAGLHVAKVERGHISGKPAIVFTRTLTDQSGHFDGIAYAAVEPGFLAAFYDNASRGENDALTVLTKDGEFIASNSGKNIHRDAPLAKRSSSFLYQDGALAVPAAEFVDGRSRIVAWEALDKYPFVSVVALDEENVYASYKALRRDYMGMVAAATILLAFVGVMGSVFSARLAWRKYQAAAIADTYRLATEGARDGFFMARALYGSNRKITDFVVENCNEQGASMLGLRKEQLIDVRFSQLYPGDVFERVMHVYREAMQNGFYEGEFHMPQEQGSLWVHRRLVRSGDGVAITMRDITETKEHEHTLQSLVNTDFLTKLPNRYWLTQYLPKILEEAQENRVKVAVLYVDLDNFKDVNNTLGHSAGDDVLCMAGQRMHSVLRPGDHVVRLGGDEFSVVLSHVVSTDDAVRVADRIFEILSRPFQVTGGSEHLVGASVGISLYPEDGCTVEQLLKHADTAMYTAKNSGKGHFTFYTPAQTERIVGRINNEQALRDAVEANQFLVYYQPRVNAATGELVSMEALVRWMHPQRGIVPPLDFIPLAEETGLIVPIGEFVIEQACAQLSMWQKQQLRAVPISVNVSPRQFAHSDLKSVIAACIARHGISPMLLEVEITESCMMQDSAKVAEDIVALKSLGIRVAVDDFGTGYSSLSQLQRLDLNVLKVDRAFTQALVDGKHGEAFFMTIVSMAHILNMQVVAEGVETLEQLTILQALGCNEVQGYFISEPVPADDAAKFLGQRTLFRHAIGILHVA